MRGKGRGSRGFRSRRRGGRLDRVREGGTGTERVLDVMEVLGLGIRVVVGWRCGLFGRRFGGVLRFRWRWWWYDLEEGEEDL